ncbi:MAG: hypothetical protein K1V75_05985 [Muribaculaceae bacterium]
MKKLILMLIIMAFVTASGHAKLRLKSFTPGTSACVIEMIDDKAHPDASLQKAMLRNDGKDYEATWYQSRMADDGHSVIYRMVFPFMTCLNHTTVILEINGKKVKKEITSDIMDYLWSNPALRDL